MERQPRKVKILISDVPGRPRILRLVPAQTTPRLKYHGVDPTSLVAIDIDVYLPTSERGQYRYDHTIFGNIKDDPA